MSDLSLQAKIFELISNLRDTAMRIDVATTISFLSDLFNMGRISEEELRDSLSDVCMTVFKETKKNLDTEILKELVDKTVEDLVTVIKLTGIRRRVSARYGLRL